MEKPLLQDLRRRMWSVGIPPPTFVVDSCSWVSPCLRLRILLKERDRNGERIGLNSLGCKDGILFRHGIFQEELHARQLHLSKGHEELVLGRQQQPIIDQWCKRSIHLLMHDLGQGWHIALEVRTSFLHEVLQTLAKGT